MTRNEAFKAMIDGHKITHESLPENSYCFFDGGTFYVRQDNYKQTYIHLSEYEDGYEIYQEPKKTEKVVWYRVTAHKNDDDEPCTLEFLFKSKDHFLGFVREKESDFHWIKLEEVYTHEYEVENESR